MLLTPTCHLLHHPQLLAKIEVVVPPGHSPRAGSEEQDSEDGPPETEQTNGRNLEYDDSQEKSPTLADGFGGFVTPKEANPSELQEKPETGRQLSGKSMTAGI
jgi:hypothetical protein